MSLQSRDPPLHEPAVPLPVVSEQERRVGPQVAPGAQLSLLRVDGRPRRQRGQDDAGAAAAAGQTLFQVLQVLKLTLDPPALLRRARLGSGRHRARSANGEGYGQVG